MKMEILSYSAEPLHHVSEPKSLFAGSLTQESSLRKKVKLSSAYVNVLLSAAIYVVLLEGAFCPDLDGRGTHIDHATAPTSVEERKICRIYVVGGDLNATLERLYNPGLAISWAAALAEISVIISQLYPQHSLSRIIRSKFISSTARHSAARSIRLTWKACAAWCMTISGAYLRVLCYKSLGSLFTFEMSIRDDHRLVKDGPYQVVRHPSYLGLLLTMVGLFLWHASRGSWARECGYFTRAKGSRLALLYVMMILVIITGLLLRMQKEDEALKMRFGREWDEWAGGVRFKLIPFVF